MFKRFFLHEPNIIGAIVINALIIFALYFPSLHTDFPVLYSVLEWLDHLFIVLFIIEAIVKIQDKGWSTYSKDHWNKFDFFIAFASIPSLLHFMGFPTIPNTSMLKILRLVRLVRIVRFLKFIPRMDDIVKGLGRAMKASIFVLFALVILNFILALVTCHFYGELVPDLFGNPLTSSYYIFQMFTVEGWNEIPNIIADAATEQQLENATLIAGMTRLYFILVVLFGGIFGMSLANAVFIDEMTMDNNAGLEGKIDRLEAQILELKELLEKK